MKSYFVYIMASISGVLYIGVTNDLNKRVYEHKFGKMFSFCRKYQCKKLVYFEEFNNINDAIRREKQLKGWKRFRKIELIQSINVGFEDLSVKHRFFD